MDAVRRADSGHPGTPMAPAPPAFVLWGRVLHYDPRAPAWFDRDRFVLSTGRKLPGMSPMRGRMLQEIRSGLRDRLGIATTLGFGPRYLHSTGQLRKGGTNRGIFLIVTAEDDGNIPAVGEPGGCSLLPRAQALGDVRALEDVGRRVVRIHLEAGVEEGLDRLADILTAVGTPEPVGA